MKEEKEEKEGEGMPEENGLAAAVSRPQDGNGGGTGPRHYVGIGASAGGLEALETFFSSMPPDSGLAFIVVQHLSPQYKSLMVELLSKHTEMRVMRVEDGVRVERNCVYLIPPKKLLTIFHGKLLLTEQEHTHGLNLPIDVFFRSLAEDQGDKAMGIVLSGTGSDGMRGVRAIKEAGGIVIVQDMESAKFDGMPRSAISTGLADLIVPPEEMPEKMLSYIRHPYSAMSERTDTLVSDEDNLTKIFALLRAKTGLDFTYYKPTTVARRIERRMTVNQFSDIRDYIRHLERTPREVSTLHKELLIGVTNFFRDPEAFRVVENEVLSKIFEETPEGQEIRFWVAGCSTGEEAYSLAILCKKIMDESGRHRDVKIFATDVDRTAVETAGAGVYPESIAGDLSPEILTRYFVKSGEAYHVIRAVRELVVFAPHNILKDPPFTRIDFLSCRNLLIYLQPVLQRKALDLFHFSLKPGGALFLGTSETVGDMTDYYELVNNKYRIYKARMTGRTHLAERLGVPVAPQTMLEARQSRQIGMGRMFAEDRLLDRILQTVAGQYVPPGVVVNDRLEVVHVLGDVREFFGITHGRLTSDVVKLASRDLSVPLATALNKVLKDWREISYTNIRMSGNGAPAKLVNLTARPVLEKKGQDRYILIIFDEVRSAQEQPVGEAASSFDMSTEAHGRISDLEQELQYTRENLQATIEELETSNEELQATNEELLAANEELQSTNEELQSVNEELYTVNSEYQAKIVELTGLTNDLDNLLRSTGIGTLFLDEDLTIRKYTPAAEALLHLMPHDVGRPISHLSDRIRGASMMDILGDVLKSNDTHEREVATSEGKTYIMRVMRYRTEIETNAGIVVTFIDITDLTKVRDDVKRERDLLSCIADTTTSGIVMNDEAGNIIFSNKRAEEMLGLGRDTIISRRHDAPEWVVVKPDGRPLSADEYPFSRVMAEKEPIRNIQLAVKRPDGKFVHMQVNATPFVDDSGKVSVIQTLLELPVEDCPGCDERVVLIARAEAAEAKLEKAAKKKAAPRTAAKKKQ